VIHAFGLEKSPKQLLKLAHAFDAAAEGVGVVDPGGQVQKRVTVG
jgi:hypothetical protein